MAAPVVPRGLVYFAVVMLLAGLGLVLEREYRDARINWTYSQALSGRSGAVPNAKHVWWAYDIFFVNSMDGELGEFGSDFIAQKRRNWTEFCSMDSNGDGVTNGQHLGDPCCLWQPSTHDRFDLSKHREYRRWHLTHPAQQSDIAIKHMPLFLALNHTPSDCRNYDDTVYREQFRTFYFHKANMGPEHVPVHPLKLLCLVAIIVQGGHWVWSKNLLADAFPWASAKASVSGSQSVAVFLASFFYMDVTSGVTHLILDYAPASLPVLGSLARGFQYHHDDPTAIIRISWYEYVSHVHVLFPLLLMALLLSDASPLQRLFWAWGGLWAHLFQTAHRWAHMPPAGLPWVVRALQRSGLLLSHEMHMAHHEDLESQFTILSGHTDVLLDTAVRWVPAHRYDLWAVFGVIWFLTPMFVDVFTRGRLRSSAGKVEAADLEALRGIPSKVL
mmetsp:Transcript_101282/g.285552  ORF Transcript_101282/g.285552 Transcript_101282/m.285552 type:complete len:444 (+) Transcript_101282:67-1398(+)